MQEGRPLCQQQRPGGDNKEEEEKEEEARTGVQVPMATVEDGKFHEHEEMSFQFLLTSGSARPTKCRTAQRIQLMGAFGQSVHSGCASQWQVVEQHPRRKGARGNPLQRSCGKH